MKSFLRKFSILIFLFYSIAHADLHDELILLKKLFQERNYYQARELAEKLKNEPSTSFYATLVIADIDFMEGDYYAAKSKIELLLEKYPEKKELLKKKLEKIEKEEAFLKDSNKDQTKLFNIIWKTTLKTPNLYKHIQEILMDAYKKGGSFFGWYPDDIIDIMVYSSKEYQTYTITPHWSQGAYDGKIRIKINEHISYSQLKELIFHEYAHVAIAFITKGRCPTWLNEGIAQYFAEQKVIINKSNPVSTYKTLPNNWDGLDENTIKNLYQESYRLVVTIINKTDEFVIQNILNSLGKNTKLDEAIDEAVSVFGYNSQTIFTD
jgi:uncharacterized protein YjaZ